MPESQRIYRKYVSDNDGREEGAGGWYENKILSGETAANDSAHPLLPAIKILHLHGIFLRLSKIFPPTVSAHSEGPHGVPKSMHYVRHIVA